jgi:pimeloyl-ACP methyl ester carboxylesterase
MPARHVLSLVAALAAVNAASAAQAAYKTTFLQLGPAMQGMIYEPAERGAKAHIALVTIHPYSAYINHTSCANMSERGYTVICANTPYNNNQYGYSTSEALFPTIKAAIARVKQVPGVDKIVLIGHSAGAPLMAYYQNVAKNGSSVCKGPEKLLPCDDELTRDLPAADALVLLDPHLGDAFATLTYVDPAITDESKPAKRDAALDLYAKQNGYDPEKRLSNYPPEFRKTFLAAQAARNAALIARAEKLLAAVKSKADGAFADDMPFAIPGATSARLWQPDISLLRKTKKEYKLLKGDGSTPTTQLTSVRLPSGNVREAMGYGSVLNVSVRNFLGAHAVRTTPDYNQTEDDVTGVDWASSNTSTISNIKGVSIPMLIEVMTGHYFLRTGEMILEASASSSKEMVGIEGASHGITPCVPCGSSPTQFGDTVKRAYDYMDGWLAKQF